MAKIEQIVWSSGHTGYSKRETERMSATCKSLAHEIDDDQCDQMAILFFNFWPIHH